MNLQLADGVVLFSAMVAINIVRFGASWPTYSLPYYLAGFAGAVAIHLITFYCGGLYEQELRLGRRTQLPAIAGLMLSALLIVAAIELVTGRYVIPRFNLPFLFVLGVTGLGLNRVIGRLLRRRAEGPARVLIVGTQQEVERARAHLDENLTGITVAGRSSGGRQLLSDVRRTGATEVLLVSSRALDELYPEPLATLEQAGVGVLKRVSARDTLLGLAGVREVGGMPFVALRTHTLPRSRVRFKRLVELAGVVVTLPLWLAVLGVTAVYVLLAVGWPVLFWQDRVGREGRPFRMVKFRTMHPDAEEGVGPVLAKHGDPRVVASCAWLRSTRLDELPQLWNVLRGEMSVVGPRPERPEMTAHFDVLIPGYSRRHEVPPGITGLAQIYGRYHTDPEYKLGHDLQYLVNWSPVLDLQILARTIWVVLSRRV